MANNKQRPDQTAAITYAQHKFTSYDFLEREFVRLAFLAGVRWERKRHKNEKR